MNQACCTNPIVTSNYEPVGKTETLQDGMEVYTSGPADASKAVIYIYDAFGFTQLQKLGADILAASLSARVYMPDLFRGKGVPHNAFPMDTDEKKAKVQEFFTGPGDFGATAQKFPALVAELKAKSPAATKWASVGFCWGGKIVAMTSGSDAPVNASGACHPGRLDPKEASAFTIPHVCLLAGDDGTPEEQQAYKKALGESGQAVEFEVFQDQHHGWMASRVDLDDQRQKAEYERGYDVLSKFFAKHL